MLPPPSPSGKRARPSDASTSASSASAAVPARPPSLYQRFKAAVKSLKREVLALYYAVHDPRTPVVAKVLPWLVLAYALSPIDLIPDFIPVLGLLDDLLLLPGLIWLAIHTIPKAVMADARIRADNEPLRLSRNWVMAVIIFALWMAGVEYCIHLALNTWGTQEALEYEWHVLVGVAVVGSASFMCWLVAAVRKEKRKQAAVVAATAATATTAPKTGSNSPRVQEPWIPDLENGWTQGRDAMRQPLLAPVQESPYSGQDSPASGSVGGSRHGSVHAGVQPRS